MIDQFKPGSNLTIMNTYFQWGQYEDGNKILDDLICLVYKNNDNGKKYHEIIKNPSITFYVANDDVAISHNCLYIEKDKVHPVTTSYASLNKKLAEVEDKMDFYNECRETHDKESLSQLQEDPRVFSSDINIEDHYRSLFARKFLNPIVSVTKAFFDIEVDGRFAQGDFVQMGECPVNMISYMNDEQLIETQYVLRNPDNPLIQQYEEEIKSGRFTENDIKEFIKEKVGGWKQFKRYHLDEFHYRIIFFDDELDMILNFYQQVHHDKPDFIEGWNNSAFDNEYLIERIKKLGAEPADIMCDPTWEIGIVNNFVDKRNLSDLAERNDFTFISGDTVWLDQMIQYASRRKSKIGSYKSFKLDDIAEMVAGVHKLDYSNITNSVVMLPWVNFKIFSLYNLIDSICNHCIEYKCHDIEYIFQKAIMNDTGYRKIHRQTVYLINRMRKDWYDKLGYIMGNNVNKHNVKRGKYEGALVMDPLKMGNDNKMKMINAVPINIIENSIDFDFTALYPSSIEEGNIASNTQIGRLDISNRWRATYHYHNGNLNKEIPVWIFDPNNCHDFPFIEVDVKDGKNRKKAKIFNTVYTYLDEWFKKPIDLTGNGTNAIEYHEEDFTTELYERLYDNENSYMNDLYTRSGEFLENKVTDNIIEFCHRWFGLANIQDILTDIDEYYHKEKISYSNNGFWQEFNMKDHKLYVTPVTDISNKKISPVYFEDNRIHPISFYTERKRNT